MRPIRVIIETMSAIHIPEAESEIDFAALTAHIGTASELVERDERPIAIVRPAKEHLPRPRLEQATSLASATSSNPSLELPVRQ